VYVSPSASVKNATLSEAFASMSDALPLQLLSTVLVEQSSAAVG
jgi:hypothetical protein